jgi:hypothetical protein
MHREHKKDSKTNHTEGVEDHSSDSSCCNSGDILFESDEDEWFEPQFPKEM